VLALAVLGLTAWVTEADAAWPRLLMVYGKPLEKAVVVSDALGVVKIFGQDAVVNQADFKDRPYFNLALFWGQDWNGYIEKGTLGQLRPEDVKPLSPGGNVPLAGRLYPPCGNAPAVMSLTSTGSLGERQMFLQIPEDGLNVLRQFGVPLSAECKNSASLEN